MILVLTAVASLPACGTPPCNRDGPEPAAERWVLSEHGTDFATIRSEIVNQSDGNATVTVVLNHDQLDMREYSVSVARRSSPTDEGCLWEGIGGEEQTNQ